MKHTCPLCAALLSDARQPPLVSYQTREDFQIVPLVKFPGSYAVQIRTKVDGQWIHVPLWMPFTFSYRSEAAAEEAIGHWLWAVGEPPKPDRPHVEVIR